MSLKEWLESLPNPPNYPSYNREKQRIEFWYGKKMLGWINVILLYRDSKNWQRIYHEFEGKRLWRI
jgi:hypothetical protein